MGEIAVTAPDRQYSAASHSISLHNPFLVKRNVWPDVPLSFAVSSSPADCVRLALGERDVSVSAPRVNGPALGFRGLGVVAA